jgi:hypothetical protein
VHHFVVVVINESTANIKKEKWHSWNGFCGTFCRAWPLLDKTGRKLPLDVHYYASFFRKGRTVVLLKVCQWTCQNKDYCFDERRQLAVREETTDDWNQ